jgi:threonine dehydratase
MSDFYDLVARTPLEHDPVLSAEFGCNVYLKREDLQPVRSFKIRGAYHKMLQLTPSQLKHGVITASAGNHAQGVALAARKLGCKATIVMPVTTPSVKVTAVAGYGANVVLKGQNYSEAATYCMDMASKTSMVFIHPFDDQSVIDGQATLTTEILQSLPSATHLFVPVGGGGLLTGALKSAHTHNSQIKIVGVEPKDSAALRSSLDAGKRVALNHVGVFADGTAVAQIGELAFKTAHQAHDIVTVPDDQVCAALAEFVQHKRATLEPAGALGLAGAKQYSTHTGFSSDDTVVIVCSGANIDNSRLSYVLKRAELASNANVLVRIELSETPGALRQLCEQVVNGHNITSFDYRKNGQRPNARITIGLHINTPDDKANILSQLTKHNYAYVDLSNNQLVKEHGMHSPGDVPDIMTECFYAVEFPDKPGALLELLTNLGETWNISMFHYGGSAGDTGRVLIGFEGASRTELEPILSRHTSSYQPANADVLLMYA